MRTLAAVFVVTSNADNGPGTLREALTLAAANDSTQTDYINFNLPDLSESGRTIILITQLPDVSSNLIIDGTTQAGAKFGVSDTHVQLQYQTPVLQSLSGLKVINHHDVEIYGLYIRLVTNINPPSNAYPYLYSGIELKNDKNIQIGAANKGNVICGFFLPVSVNSPDGVHTQTSNFHFENLILKDNFFGFEVDGETPSGNPINAVSLNYTLGQITIGGDAAEGNIFAQGLTISQVNAYGPPATFLIKNNKIGVDYNVQTAVSNSSGLNISTVIPNGANVINIEDNVITANSGFFYGIYLNNQGEKATILRNYIGTDKTRQKSFHTGGIFLYGATQVAIGSNDPADANYITNCNPVIIWPATNATVNKNSFYCTPNTQPMHYVGYGEFEHPVINILDITANTIRGTATPNSAIELYYSDQCHTCSPQTYFASTTADADGKWGYIGAISGTIIASATLGTNTSDFTRTEVKTDQMIIANACNGTGGSIKGAVPLSATNIKWLNESGNIVGTDADLINVAPGKYKMVAQGGDCSAETPYYQVYESLQIITTNLNKRNVSCINSDGYIKGLTFVVHNPGTLIYSWKNINGVEIGQAADLINVPVGTYTLTVTTADHTCSQTYGPITLTNTTGPNIGQATATINPTPCGQSTGSITGITATGTGILKYVWKNVQGQQVATTKDLLDQPAGTYTLQVTDDTNCGPVYTSAITIPESNGVNINDAQKVISAASCGTGKGSITGIVVTGATNNQWLDDNNTVAGNAADLLAVAPGKYHLVASNSTCTEYSQVYIIIQQTNDTDYGPIAVVPNNATCDLINGSIEIKFNGSPAEYPRSYRWVDQGNGSVINTTTIPKLNNLGEGKYEVFVTNNSGCERLLINDISILRNKLTIVTNNVQVTDDNCQGSTGSIKGIAASTGKAPISYLWTNDQGQTVGTNADLELLPAGTYHLKITDGAQCEQSFEYTVNNRSLIIPAPSVTDVHLCSSGDAYIGINNPLTDYSYRLYDAPLSSTPLADEKSGRFKINIITDHNYYISAYINTCESSRAKIQVSLGNITATDLPNAFSPNGDGINDYWKIRDIENYPNAIVQVFTRSGEKVFESVGYGTPFNGTYNGHSLPIGTYYYIVNLSSGCSLLSGSLTIIR